LAFLGTQIFPKRLNSLLEGLVVKGLIEAAGFIISLVVRFVVSLVISFIISLKSFKYYKRL
jgi:hypothetical protein